MANQTIRMNILQQIIRLKAEGCTNRRIAKLLCINRKTVNKYVKRIEQLGLNWQQLSQQEE